MTDRLVYWLLLTVSLIYLSACTQRENTLSDFTSDGCSLFLDGSFESPELWKECCRKHDMSYWQGGTEEERLAADLKFKSCVEKKTGNPELAQLMYQAVRAGGTPHFPTWYRWGYGWPVGRGYKKLSDEELVMVEAKILKYRDSLMKK